MLSPSHFLFPANKAHITHRKRKELGVVILTRHSGIGTSLFLWHSFLICFFWGKHRKVTSPPGNYVKWEGEYKVKANNQYEEVNTVLLFFFQFLEKRISYLLIIHMQPTSPRIFEAVQCDNISVTPTCPWIHFLGKITSQYKNLIWMLLSSSEIKNLSQRKYLYSLVSILYSMIQSCHIHFMTIFASLSCSDACVK